MYFKLVWWCVIDSCNRSLWSGEWIKKATETYISTQSIQAVYPSPVLNMWRDRSLSSVLTNRQSTAKLIWQNGEKALTKALVASKLYRFMVSKSAWDYDWKVNIHDELQSNEAEFSRSTFIVGTRILIGSCLLANCPTSPVKPTWNWPLRPVTTHQ